MFTAFCFVRWSEKKKEGKKLSGILKCGLGNKLQIAFSKYRWANSILEIWGSLPGKLAEGERLVFGRPSLEC